MKQENPNILDVLKGSRLSAITFVHDYVQLHFDGPGLTAITPARVHRLNETFEWGMPEYRNVLCEQIGKLVRRAFTLEAQEIKIDFEDGSSISISLRPADYRAAEAAVFDNPPNPTCVW
jgi:hypothetical protein